ncbi:hypothetical protein [Fimbriiglobus ruber]|uniref:Uncharacterized protein n=1 Tax=Fimbriiglobus ruber TaxID=1908690 RepID=A0A225D3F8_9BACT|nr:hypothetical protein [Fimbriiglobus ruber]OWK35493.1 hypothetical protein FRUB_08056 [Fimbriiglobus ruber]
MNEIGDGGPAFPSVAIENGRAFISRLESNYRFEDEGRSLATNAEWDELKRCFEYMVECLAHSTLFIRSVKPLSEERAVEVMATAINDFEQRAYREAAQPEALPDDTGYMSDARAAFRALQGIATITAKEEV